MAGDLAGLAEGLVAGPHDLLPQVAGPGGRASVGAPEVLEHLADVEATRSPLTAAWWAERWGSMAGPTTFMTEEAKVRRRVRGSIKGRWPPDVTAPGFF